MKIKRSVPLFIVGLLLIECSGQQTTPSEESTIEGTVKYFPSGGKVEIQCLLSGFILNDYQWITAPSWLVSPSPSDSLHHVYPGIYLKRIIDYSYIDKRVKVVGNPSQSTISDIFPNYEAI